MITKITESIFTAGYSDLDTSDPRIGSLVDVRNLVDKEGNNIEALIGQINAAEKVYKTKGEVVIACDMGISRSRVIAIGLLTKLGWNYDDALRHIRSVANKPEINLSLLKELKQYLKLSRSTALSRKTGRVIVLGGSGFIGSHIVKSFSFTRQVVAPSSAQINLLTDAIELDEIIDGQNFETLIFAAHPKAYHTTKAFADSLSMLKNALEVARHHNINFIYISSLVVFSGNAERFNKSVFEAKETEIPVPWGTYAESKYLGEELVRMYSDNYGIHTIIIRAAGLYGLGMSPTWLIPKLVQKALVGEEIMTHEYDNGLPLFELLHVKDFADAIICLIKEENWPSIIHIGSRHTISTRDLAQQIVGFAKSSSKCGLMRISGKVHNIVSSPGGYIERLNWSPRISLDEGLKSIILKVLS